MYKHPLSSKFNVVQQGKLLSKDQAGKSLSKDQAGKSHCKLRWHNKNTCDREKV